MGASHEMKGRVMDLMDKALKTNDFDTAMQLSTAIIDVATADKEELSRDLLFTEACLVDLMRRHGVEKVTLTDEERQQHAKQMHCHLDFDEATKTATIRTCSEPNVGEVLEQLRGALKTGDPEAYTEVFAKIFGNRKGGAN